MFTSWIHEKEVVPRYLLCYLWSDGGGLIDCLGIRLSCDFQAQLSERLKEGDLPCSMIEGKVSMQLNFQSVPKANASVVDPKDDGLEVEFTEGSDDNSPKQIQSVHGLICLNSISSALSSRSINFSGFYP